MESLKNVDLYEVLGINKDATAEEIKKAYRAKAKEHHEDKVGGNKEKMILINRAWAVLKDPIKRKHYDETGEENSLNFDQKFEAMTQKLFFKAIAEAQSIEHVDLIKKFKEEISKQLEEQKTHLENAQEAIEKLQKIINRLTVKKGENRISRVLSMNMIELKKLCSGLESDVSFFNDALEVVEHYKYNFDGDGREETSPLWRGIKYGGMNI